MTDRFTHDAGPYVLGALPPEDRRAFEEHLATCGHCRSEVQEFAGLPGLLSRLPAGELPAVLQGSPEPPPPVSVLPALLSGAGVERRSRRRRTAIVGIAAALAVAAGSAGITEAIVNEPAAVVAQPPAPQPFIKAETGLPVAASAVITDVPGGTRIAMTCQYSGPLSDEKDSPPTYNLRYVPTDGSPPHWIDSWPVLSGHPYKVDMVVPVTRDKISKFEVIWNGKTVLSLPAS
jgi:Putative zinc-finger